MKRKMLQRSSLSVLAFALLALALCGNALPSEWYPCSVSDSDEPRSSSEASAAEKADIKSTAQRFNNPFRPAQPDGRIPHPGLNNPAFPIQCIKMNISLNWDDPKSPNITYFMKRFVHINGAETGKANVWLIDGGPGGAGGAMNDLALNLYLYLGGQYNVYLPHHRGTGYSTRLGCPDEFKGSNCSKELNDQYGDNLHYFSTTMATKDLAFSIRLVTSGLQTNIVYGVSYGTYFLNRFLMLYPDLASKVIMDGVCPSTKCRVLSYDTNVNIVTEKFFEYCGNDTACSLRLGDPSAAWEQVGEFIAKAENGSYCIENERPGYTDGDFRVAIRNIQSSESLRELLPAFIYRTKRCNNGDKDALIKFFDQYMSIFKGSAPAEPLFSGPELSSKSLGYNLIFMELFNDTYPLPTCKESYEETEKGNAGIYIGYDSCMLKPHWNAGMPDEYYNLSPKNIQAPTLIINGDLDTATPVYFADMVLDTYVKNGFSSVQLVVFEQGVHALALVSEQIDSLVPCGVEVIGSFILSETGQVDKRCLDKRISLDFVPETDRVKTTSKQYFGTEDLWGDSKQSGDAASAISGSSRILLFALLAVAGIIAL